MEQQILKAYADTIMAVATGPNPHENKRAITELLAEMVAKSERPTSNNILLVQPSNYFRHGRRAG